MNRRTFPSILACAALAAGFVSLVHAAAPAQGHEPPAANAAPAAPPAPPPPAAAKPPVAPHPFKDVIKDAKQYPGFFTVWKKEDHTWIEIRPDQMDKPFYFAAVRTSGLGEHFVIAGLMDARYVVYFRKVHGQVQLMAKNTRFTATENPAVEHAVSDSFSESLVASAPPASEPEPDTHAILVDASALLLGDIAGASTMLEGAFHLPYALDAKNSSIMRADPAPEATGFNVQLHFAVPKLPVQDPHKKAGPGPQPTPPVNVPDPRNFFLDYHYDFAQLPAPMRPRIADERVGYFTTQHVDYGNDINPSPNVYYINRWRLEKKDPTAALSEPVKPIVYWLDKDIPVKYRQAIADGVLEWNKAFERIGFKDAIQVKIQPDDATFDTADIGHASIRWYLSTENSPAIGPSHVDPRTGEILDADILFTDVFTRGSRRFVADDIPQPKGYGALANGAEACTFAEQEGEEAQFAMDLLAARGQIDPGSPEADRFVYNYVKEVIMHEVGHTLGLRHNFRASTAYTAAQLRDPAFTAEHGVVASIMDYAPFNIPLEGEKATNYVNPTIGPYDYWAIEYGYKPLDPAHEKAELDKIVEHGSKDPWLAYATDEDSFVGGSPEGMDPTVNIFDLTNNPLGYYRKRLELSRELWNRLEARQLAPGESYDGLRRGFLDGFRQLGRGLAPATKYIGGIVQLRDRAGTGRVPFTPVSAAEQREALKILSDGMFSVDSFKFKPRFLASLPFDRLDYAAMLFRGEKVPKTPMISLSSTVLKMQQGVLDQVMSAPVAERLIDSQGLAADPKEAFRLSELYETLQASIWSELRNGREITAMRRNLQREHLRRVVDALVKPQPNMPADARSLLRMDALALAGEIRRAQSKPAYSKETRAHLAESLETLEQALKAPIQRVGT